MKLFFVIALILVLGLSFSGCNTVGEVLPPNDEVLVYPLPFDLTYLRTMEALEDYPDWQVDETDKEKGIIKTRNTNYSRLDDSDLRSVTFMVKRVDRGTTSVSIAPESQKVFGGGELMKAVASALAIEIKSHSLSNQS